MVVRIVVFDPEDDSLDGSTFDDWGPLPSAPAFINPNKVLTDDALDPANIVEQGAVAWSDLTLP